MKNLTHPDPFPRGALIGAALLIGSTLLLAVGARLTGVGVTTTDDARITAAYAVRFEDKADGSVSVYQGRSDELIISLAPGTNGFVRGVMRGLARERRMHDVGSAEPFMLNQTTAGELRLHDPTIGRTIDLQAFGADNFGAFANIFAAAEAHGDNNPATPPAARTPDGS